MDIRLSIAIVQRAVDRLRHVPDFPQVQPGDGALRPFNVVSARFFFSGARAESLEAPAANV
jgi:hypothetical protein